MYPPQGFWNPPAALQSRGRDCSSERLACAKAMWGHVDLIPENRAPEVCPPTTQQHQPPGLWNFLWTSTVLPQAGLT
ncbi:rCG20217 [Rattus norvegicus]|uniref:RCG20217 n=1 Tax=Rattus norvegicus TaxID=10116 RepID=A6JGD4_RAT|nr:rCG20217 [Rattus norvegicus]